MYEQEKCRIVRSRCKIHGFVSGYISNFSFEPVVNGEQGFRVGEGSTVSLLMQVETRDDWKTLSVGTVE
ncbi:uncharacterized protein Bfra_007381 [Botrytis fragariae]|uniref:Uncharacterized protein n=1 Tax=Botrytis fragariae TaxID=1964551 RepID=A0A8H6EDR7_9HELO|nr:uncharacterized protein Bfra_007381 [Botrytis fragariae]KAF5868185.1 hypothetical protein Bfra_007381 [Botrytis fragariae]